MRVLVTGNRGYIGVILAPMLQAAGHDVVGLDNGMFDDSVHGPAPAEIPTIEKDVRDATPEDLVGIDAVFHLAGISNDPVGDLDPDTTDAINHRATVSLATAAKEAGVGLFVFSSSCSIYGASPGGLVDETAPVNPVTPYGWSKINAERGIFPLLSDDFSVVALRNATAFGYSPKLRADLVVNNLVGYAHLEGKVFMKSDGTPWRPLIHIEDISRAFAAVLATDRTKVHGEVFDVAAPGENYQIRDVAEIVESVVDGSRVELAETAGPDIRNYRVEGAKFRETVPEFQPVWTVKAGAEQVASAYREHGLTEDQFFSQLLRVRTIKALQAAGRLSADLRVESANA